MTKKSTQKTPRRKQGSRNKTSKRLGIGQWRSWLVILPVLAVLFAAYLVWLDFKILKRFEGRMWQLPAKVYARPLELYAGKPVTPAQLRFELELLGYTEQQQLTPTPGIYHLGDASLDIHTRGHAFQDGDEPARLIHIELDNNVITTIQDTNSGDELALVRLEPAYIAGIFPQHGEDRDLLDINDVPDIFLTMLVLTEDRRFFSHHGIDFHAIARALLANIKAGRTVQGGSTLTQQLVKNLYLSSERSLLRKVNEALMAVLLELHYDKRTILQTYLNEIYLGQDRNRSIHGFGLASQFYFSKPLQQLSYDQMALLVGMVKGASYYNPARNPQRARQRRDVILNTMQKEGVLSENQYQALIRKDVVVVPHRKRTRYPAFMDLVKRQLKTYYDEEDLQAEGLNIFTTLDPYVQQQAEQAVTESMQSLFKSRPDMQIASVIVRHGSGDVLALIGDANPKYPGFNRALDARRQIGSLIKPVVYLAALSAPERYTLATVLDDSEIELTNELGVTWAPQNYDREFHGELLLFDALLQSRNVPAVKTGLDIGLGAIARTLRNLGGDHDIRLLPSLTLGAIDMTPFEIAGIYQTFAADGFDTPLQSVYAVTDKHGKPLTRNEIEVQRNVQHAPLSLINYALVEVARQGTARRLSRELTIRVAGKTGTSDELRDSWFAGFSGELVSVVWMGYDDNRPSGLTGSSGAMRVWSKLMRRIASTDYPLQLDENIEFHSIDRDTGLLGGPGCENTIQLPFIKGSQPTRSAECADQGGGWFDRLFGN